MIYLLALLLALWLAAPAAAQQNPRGFVTTAAPVYTNNSFNYLSLDTGGSLRVTITGGAGSGGTSATDKSAWVAGTTAGTPAMGAFDDVAPNTLAEDTVGVVRLTSFRAFHVNLRDNSGNEVTVGGGTQYDQGTVSTATDKLTMAGAVRHDTATVDAGVADGDRLVLSTDAVGRLRTTSADTTQPVSGTVTANAGSGTFTVAGTVTANQGGAWTVTANAGTNLNTSALLLDATFTGRINTQGQKTMAASTPVVIASDQSAVPVSGTVTTTPPANASTNVTQFGGTNISTGTGASGAGIPRVTVANDSNILATQSGAWNVTLLTGSATIGAVTGTAADNSANSTLKLPVLVARANAAAPTWTEGNQVPLSVDNSGMLRVLSSGGGLAVVDAAAWTAGVSQMTPTGGEYNPTATPLAAGTQGTVALTAARGLQANVVDSVGRELGAVLPGKYSPPQQVSLVPAMPAPPQLGVVTRFINFVTGQGLGTPVNLVTATGGQASNGVMPTIYCNKNLSIDTAASGSTQIVPLIGGQAIYVCGFDWISTSALSVKFVYGTGTNCATGAVNLEGAQAVAANGGKVIPVAMPKWFIPAGQALCINLSGATQVSGSVTYGQF